jgi:hypothetical protein
LNVKRSLILLTSTCVLLAAGAIGMAAGPATAPATHPAARSHATAPASRPAAAGPKLSPEQLRRRVTQLTRRSIALLEERKLDEAEPVLLQAVSLDPTSYINLYNLACLKALRGQAEVALDYLERAADAGYTDFIHLAIDPDLTSLRDLPRYRTFVAKKPLYQRRAADRALASLKQQFGDGYLYELDEQDKLIFATNVDRETLDALKKSLKAQARSQWAQLFEHRPDEFIRVVVPSPQDYKKLIRMPGVGGIYMDGSKLLIAQRLGQVMTHEFTHALHAADRAPLDQEHPIWLVEGLGSLFEASSFEGPNHDVLVPHDNFRVTYLQHAASGSDSKLIPLEKLLKMEQPEFVNKANMAYGESSSFLLYLYEQKQLKPFYDAFKKSYDADPTGRAALEQVTGKKLPELEKDWVAWLKRRTPPPMSTGPEGAFLGAQLGGPGTESNDGLRIGTILPKGPAEKAGLKVGDVLVAINAEALHDFQSFGPMMSRYKPGQQITLRVRRDGKYLDVPVLLGKRSEAVNAEPRQGRRGGPTTNPATRPTSSPATTRAQP